MASTSVPPPRAELLTIDTERDPEGPLRAVAWGTVAFALAQVLLFGFGRDQTIYAVVGGGVVDGAMPYRDLWDFKPPGVFLVYALSFAVLGKTMVAPRIAEALFLVGAVLGLRRLGGKLFESRTAGLVGGALYALVHAQFEFWHTGQPESFGGPLTVFALVLLTHRLPRRRWVWSDAGVGLLLGGLFLLKPTLALVALPFAVYAYGRERELGHGPARSLLPTLVFALGSLVPLALIIVWFGARGALPELTWTLFDFTPGYTKLGWREHSPVYLLGRALIEPFFLLSALLGAGVVAAGFADRNVRVFRRAHGLLLACIVAQLGGVALQAKFFEYHYGATLPLVGLIAGVGYHRLYRRYAVGSRAGALAFSMLVIALGSLRVPVGDVPLGFWRRSALRLEFLLSAGRRIGREELDEKLYRAADFDLASTRRVGRYLLGTTPLDSSVFVWGFEPGVYWFSNRRPASRFLYDVPQRALWERDEARALLMDDLAKSPPEAIVVQSGDRFRFVTGDELDSAAAVRTFPEFESLLRGYALESSIDDFSIWRRARKASPP